MKLRWAKFLTGLLLLPPCLALTMTLWRALVILAQSPTRLPMLHAFAGVAGIVIWAIIWLYLPPLTRTYVLGHELTHALWTMLFGGKASGLLTFGVKGGREAGARFQDAVKLFTRLVNIGDAKSLVCHPASTTHRQLSPDELKKAGVTEDTVRLSVGIEHIDDLIADLEQALAAV